MDIGSLTGTVALEDQLSGQLTILASRVKQFGEDFDGAMGAVVIGAGLAVTAILGAAVSITKLGEHGSDVADVSASFTRLAGSTANADQMLTAMRHGVVGTISDFDLMKGANRLLEGGFKGTAEQFKTMTEAARLFAHEGARPVAEMLSEVDMAIQRGVVPRQMRGMLNVDLAKTEKDYAASIGLMNEPLTRQEKLLVDRNAILAEMAKKVSAAGFQETTFKEKIEAISTAMANWSNNLAEAVARSPHVNAALDALSTAWVKAFGGENQSLLDRIVGWVDRFADATTKWGPVIIQELADIRKKVLELWHEVEHAWDMVPDWFKNIARDATLAGGAVIVVSKGFAALGGGGGGGSALSSLADMAQIWTALPIKIRSVIPAIVALTEATGLLGIAMTGVVTSTAVLGSVAIGGALYQVAQLTREALARDADAYTQIRTDAANLLILNKALGTSYTTLDAAMQAYQQRRKDLASPFIPAVSHGNMTTPAEDQEAQEVKLQRQIAAHNQLATAHNQFTEAMLKGDEQEKKWATDLAAAWVETATRWDAYFTTVDKALGEDSASKTRAAERWYEIEVTKLALGKEANLDYYNQLAVIEATYLQRRTDALMARQTVATASMIPPSAVPFEGPEEVGAAAAAHKSQQAFGASWGQYMSTTFGQTIVGAMQGGGSVWKSLGTSIGSQIGMSVSAAIVAAQIGGRMASSIIGGLASMGISLVMLAIMGLFDSGPEPAASAPLPSVSAIPGRGQMTIHINNVTTLDGRVVAKNTIQRTIGNEDGLLDMLRPHMVPA